MGGGKGGGSEVRYIYPEVEETPERKGTQSVTAAAQSAVQQQQQRASRNRGVAASILSRRQGTSSNSQGLTSNVGGNTTLGQ